MKREGYQHGMVRSFIILPSPLKTIPKSKIVNKLDSRPTAGLYTKVSSKPTNHSKFTGKCGATRCNDCHTHPVNKSKDKAKGTQKLKSCNVAINHRSLDWRVVDTNKRNCLNYDGKSATGILCHISSSEYVDDYVDDDDEIEIYEGDEPRTSFKGATNWSKGIGFVLDYQVEEEEDEEGWCVL